MAAPKLVSARQNLIVAYIDLILANFVTNVDVAAIEVPAGAVVLGGNIVTTEAWNSTTSDVLDVGDLSIGTVFTGVQNRYLNDGNIRALGALVPIVPTGFVYTMPTKISVRWVSGGGVPTTGKSTLMLNYYVRGRGQFAQGLDS